MYFHSKKTEIQVGAILLLKALGEIPPCIFQCLWSQVFSSLYGHNFNFCLFLHMVPSSSPCVSVPCGSLRSIFVMDFSAHQIIQDDLIQRSLVISSKTLFPKKLLFLDSGDENLDISLLGGEERGNRSFSYYNEISSLPSNW